MVGAFTKLSAKVIDQAVNQVTKQQQFNGTSGENSPFKQMLDSIGSGEQMASDLGMKNQNVGLPSSNMNAISGVGMNIDTTSVNTGVADPNGTQKIVDLLSEVNNGQMQMENMVNQILYSGKRFSNQELLAIQAHVFHFAQITELVVKAADQGVSSLKSVMNTNIQ